MKIEIIETKTNIPKHMFLQNIQTHRANTNNQPIVNITLNHSFITKGFFIGGNLDSISNLKLTLNGHDRFDYNEILLQTICIKINDGLFYIPLDINEAYDTCTELSYKSSLNLSRIDCVKFIGEFKNTPTTLGIYSLSGNYLKHYNGCTGLVFSN